MFIQALRRYLHDIVTVFSGKNLVWHILACALTVVIVLSGFDQWYFVHTRNPLLFSILIPSAGIGGLFPIIVPLGCLIVGLALKHAKTVRTAWALTEAGVLGMLVSMFYKAFTGREHPPFLDGMVDLSHGFRFGWMKGGVFWGWPSSHTTVAFACALTLCTLYPRNVYVRFMALAYAIYIGIGVSTTIHWFSEFAAGAIFGSVIGVVVGKSFLKLSSGGKR